MNNLQFKILSNIESTNIGGFFISFDDIFITFKEGYPESEIKENIYYLVHEGYLAAAHNSYKITIKGIAALEANKTKAYTSKAKSSIKTEHPWQVGPTELIDFALERMHKGSDFDRRLAFLILDVGVETLFKTYLTLPESVTQFHIKRSERLDAADGNFHELLRGVQNANPQKALELNFAYIEYYHNLRNTLYHQGNHVTAVPLHQVEGYAKLAVDLLREYLDADLSEKLSPPESVKVDDNDPVVDSVEVEVSFGRYRIERLKSQSIRAFSITTSSFETPVKPFLRAVIDELSLPIEFTLKNGVEKNTRTLGKDVINELRPSAWHGLVPGQKVKKDALIALLTGRLRDGGANPKNWEMVDIVRNLSYDTLVFRPTGKGVGNSPFNIYCWWTESGKPIKKD